MSSNKPAFIATIIVFILAVAAAVFAFLKISGNEELNGGSGEPASAIYRPTEEIKNEMQDAAEHLIKSNHTIIRLYITRGLEPKQEPYVSPEKPLGNRPEDGAYYVINDEYKTLADVESIVDQAFTPEESNRIKENRLDSGSAYYSEFGRIYVDKNGELGINAAFAEYLLVPYEDYPINWSNPTYTISPVGDEECLLRVVLHTNDDKEVAFERTMYKTEGEWRLNRLIHE